MPESAESRVPASPPAISAMVAVPEVARALEWYKRALGAKELWNLGSVIGMEIDGAPFFLAEPEENDWATPERIGTTGSSAIPSATGGTWETSLP